MLLGEEAPGPSKLLKSGICLGSHVVESLRQGVDSSPARGVHSRGQLPALVLGTTPGAQRRLSIPGSRLVGALLLPSRQVSRCTLCYRLDSPTGRGPGLTILTISVAAGAALGTTKCGTGILGVAATRDRGTLVFLVLSREGLAKKLWLVRPWGGGAAGESGWRVGGCDQAVRQHLVSKNLLGPEEKCVALPTPATISYRK